MKRTTRRRGQSQITCKRVNGIELLDRIEDGGRCFDETWASSEQRWSSAGGSRRR
ncbi:uncharacterized protein LOC143212662 isoform X2 [Lasioglossum baleicum]|uniref:uncharacterized protein LOC143212662 isoform X2 n=1 Tax=Lasioglossum baleicum TaxID=434251 RepID=UPI003FCCA8E3